MFGNGPYTLFGQRIFEGDGTYPPSPITSSPQGTLCKFPGFILRFAYFFEINCISWQAQIPLFCENYHLFALPYNNWASVFICLVRILIGQPANYGFFQKSQMLKDFIMPSYNEIRILLKSLLTMGFGIFQ
ncbi:MAG: hypothetical protein LBC11_00350 [Puniceicoccales bacterium]|jgi:hypothetical protein|nr:hypothetical protein [Puniceicoccales bacterium]